MRILGRAPAPTDLESTIRHALHEELAGFETLDSSAVTELVRDEVQRLVAAAPREALRPAIELEPIFEPEPPPRRAELRRLPTLEPQGLEEVSLDSLTSAGDGSDLGVEALQKKLGLYERRIRKLCGSLDRAEAALAEMLERGGGVGGISSVYRTVQGLDRDDARYEKKHELLSQILQANLDLQKRGA